MLQTLYVTNRMTTGMTLLQHNMLRRMLLIQKLTIKP